MADQLFDNYADIAALEKQTAQVIGMFTEVEQGIGKLSKLGFKIDAAKGMAEASSAARDLAKTQAQLETTNKKLFESEQKLGALREQAALKNQKLQADIAAKQAQTSKTQTQEDAIRLKSLIEQEKQLARVAALEGRRSSKATPQSREEYVNSIPFTHNLDQLEAEHLSNLQATGEAVNDLEREQAQAANTATAWNDSIKQGKETTNETQKAVKEAVWGLGKYTGTLQENIQAQLENNLALAKNKAAQKEIQTAIKQSGGATDAQIAQLATLKQEELLIAESGKQLAITTRNQAKEFLSAKGSTEQLRSELNLLQQQYEQLSATERATPFGKAIKQQIDVLDPALKASEGSIGKHQRSVGNYAGAVSKAVGGTFKFLKQIAYLVPGIGIAGILGFISEAVIDLVSSLFSGTKALNQYALNLAALNDVMAEANILAGKEATTLRILYNAATDNSMSTKLRTDAVKALKKEFPDYFKAIDAEKIKNGEAADTYKELAAAIQLTSRATAAKAKLDTLEAGKLDLEFQKQKVENATANERGRIVKKFPGVEKLEAIGADKKTPTTDLVELAAKLNLEADDSAIGQLKAIAARKKKALDEIEKKDKGLQGQIDFLTKFATPAELAKVTAKQINGKDPKEKTVKDELDKRLAEERKANFELQKLRIQDEIETQKTIASIETIAIDDRLRARQTQTQEELRLNKLEQDEELAQIDDRVKEEKKRKGIGSAEISAIERAASVQRIKVIEERAGKVKDIEFKSIEDIAKIREQASKQIQGEADKDIERFSKEQETRLKAKMDLNKKFYDSFILQNSVAESTQKSARVAQYQNDLKEAGSSAKKKKEITEKFNADISNIDLDFAAKRIQNDIDMYQTQGNILSEFGFNTLEADEKLAKARLDLQLLNQRKKEEALSTEINLTETLKQGYVNLAQTVAQTFEELIAGTFDKRKNQLQEEIDLIEEAKNAEIDRVTNSTLTAEQKAAKIKVIEAKAQGDREKLEQRQRKLDHDKAVFERAFKGFQIVTEGISSVAKIKAAVIELTAKAAANPLLLPLIPLAAAQIPISIATSAANLVALLATPIPKYSKGITYAPGGLSLVGEAGRELAEKDGNYTLYTKPTFTNIPRGTRIHSNTATEKILAASARERFNITATVTPTEKEDRTDEVVDALKRIERKSRIVIINDRAIESSAYYDQQMKH